VPPESQRALLVFQIAGHTLALPLENVVRVVPMAQLAQPPGLPPVVEGILNLEGSAIPVLRLDRLLQLPPSSYRLYSMLILLKGLFDGPMAILVDRVNEVVSLPTSSLLDIAAQDSPHDWDKGCAEAAFLLNGQLGHLLSPSRVLLARERASMSALLNAERLRLLEWEPRPQ
jgi:purine-binding chemotaxis protein CheW